MRFLLISVLLLAACDKPPTAAAPDAAVVLTAAYRNDQIMPAATFFPLVVTVTRNFKPVIGDSVTFTHLGSDGGVFTTGPIAFVHTTDVVVTDSTGSALIVWLTASHVGADSMRASVQGAPPITFAATITAGPLWVSQKLTGDTQTAPAGSALATLPAIKAIDQFGNAVSGVNVTFALTSGGGSISGASAVTDARGIATLGGWTLGSVPGSNIVTAYAPAALGVVIPFTFTETGTTPSATSR